MMSRNTLVLLAVVIVVLISLAFIFGGKKGGQEVTQETPIVVPRPDFGTGQSRVNNLLPFSDNQGGYDIIIPIIQPERIIISPVTPKTSRQAITTQKPTNTLIGTGRNYFNYGQIGPQFTSPNFTAPQSPSTIGDTLGSQPTLSPDTGISGGIEDEAETPSPLPTPTPSYFEPNPPGSCSWNEWLTSWLMCLF